MKYNEFMKAVDERLSVMTEMEKIAWIHNMARTAKEQQRSAFLNSLKESRTEKQADYQVIHAKKEVENWCRKIEAEEIYFERSGYEEYGENYWDNDYSYEYTDAFDIGKNLYDAFQIAEDLLSQKEYEQASVLYDRLCRMRFPVLDSDTGEGDELELKELEEEKLISLNLKQITLNLMYAKYQTAGGRERAAELYRYLSWEMCKNIKVEEMFSAGPEELQGTDLFMEEWIAFLKNNDGDRAGNLLSEACLYQGGVRRLGETAGEAWERHPVLFENACQHLLHAGKNFECEKLGLEAVRLLPENLVIRGKIADLTAKAAELLEHPDILEECYQAAFYAESTLNHYLRLFELPDYKNLADSAAQYAQTLPEHSMQEGYHQNKQLQINHISTGQKKVILFFNGQFDLIYEECIKDKTGLGWSTRFKGIAVPLFILLLDQGKKITKTGQRLIDGIPSRLGFQEDDRECFEERFVSWKEKIVLTDEQYEKYMAWLKEEVDKRTEAVVGGGYRNSYYKAAALITALGETMESNGKLGGKAMMIEYYKKMYSRKRAFKAEFE